MEPGEIGRAVQSIVAATLADLGYSPRPEFFSRIGAFAATLALWGSKLNLTSAPDDPGEIAFHIVDSLAPLMLAQSAAGAKGDRTQQGQSLEVKRTGCSAAHILADAFDEGVRVLDLGSGAGFPSLILAAACDADFTLLEARRKRASFLAVAAAEMGLANVRVDASRTDSMTLGPVFEVVTARAFAEPAIVYRTAALKLKAGGHAIIYAGPSQRSAIEEAVADNFELPDFIPYELRRGPTSVAHLIAVAKRRH